VRAQEDIPAGTFLMQCEAGLSAIGHLHQTPSATHSMPACSGLVLSSLCMDTLASWLLARDASTPASPGCACGCRHVCMVPPIQCLPTVSHPVLLPALVHCPHRCGATDAGGCCTGELEVSSTTIFICAGFVSCYQSPERPSGKSST
jgi:hypothetical protein